MQIFSTILLITQGILAIIVLSLMTRLFIDYLISKFK